MSRARWCAPVVILSLAAAIAGCANLGLGGLLPGATPSADDGAPSFESLTPSRNATSAANNQLTFTVDASAPGGKPVTFTWEASAGVLSTKTGRTVTWTAADAKGGKLPAGGVVLTVTASDGARTASREIVLTVDENGVATMPTINVVTPPQGTTPPSSINTGPASGTPSSITPASGTPSVACRIGGVQPALAAPGSLVYVTGQGFAGKATVTVGGQAAQVVSVKPQWIAALVPGSAQASATALPVAVNVCGQQQSVGNLLVGSEDAFGAATTQAGQGLLVQVYTIPDDTQNLPDLSTLSPVTSFVAGTIAVPSGALTTGISSPSGPITDDFALRYTGQLSVESPGFTNFSLTSQDGARLIIDGATVVNNDGLRASPTTKTGSANLSRGLHPFELDYFDVNGGNVSLQLNWDTPGGLAGAIPASAFELPATFGP